MDIIRITTDVYSGMLNHSRLVLPAEAVGLLGGPAPDYLTINLPLPNRAGHHAFLADPFAQFKAERYLKQSGLHLLAIYHSHPGGGAQLSPLDLVFANKRSRCLQIVIALQPLALSNEEVRAYRVTENAVVEVNIHIEVPSKLS
jgi:[CysO sulfur-carrier protein]-S-L-cysteine hydrolase